MDRDGDGIPDNLDSWPDDPTNGTGYNYNGTWYAGTWADADYDGIPDPADAYPNDQHNGTGYFFGDTWYDGTWTDSDGDGIPDPADSYPGDANNGNTSNPGYDYNGTWYSGDWIDSDSDGIPDPADAYPSDPNNGASPDPGYYYNGVWYSGTWQDTDGDGIPDWLDSYPNDQYNGSYYYNGNWYTGPWADFDGDGIPDPADSYPYDATNGNPGYSYNGIWYNGSWMDSDNDGIPDPADSYPYDANNGGYFYNGNWYSGSWWDSDNDGIPDPADAYPFDPNNNAGFWWGGLWYYGYWTDSDSDGIPDAADTYPNDANNGNYLYAGNWYTGPWADADGDGIPDPADAYPFDPYNGGYIYNGTWYPGPWADYDNDGIPDPADNYVADPENGADSDGDGLTNYEERTQYGTNPVSADTDNDRLSDFEEIYTWHTNPLQEKTDPNQVYTDYYLVDQTDSDGDHIPDRIEQWYASQGYGMNMSDPNDGAGDLDGDGYSNLEAYRNGWNLVADLDRYDGDSDGIPDVLEDAWNAKYPGILSKTEPNDAVQDYEGDGLMNFEEIGLGLDPGNSHSFGANISDIQYWIWCICTGVRSSNFVQPELTCNGSLLPEWLDAADDDHDGVQNGLQAMAAALTADPSLITLPPRVFSTDCDGDGMPDLWEYNYRFNLRYDDSQGNADWDSLNNLEEYQHGRNPLVYDDPPQFTNTPDDGMVGMEYYWVIGVFSPVANSSDDITFAITEGSLPSGLRLNSARWCVEGMPTMMGSSTFTLKATDNNGQSVSQTFTINIQQGPLQIVATSTLPDGVVNTPYSADIQVLGGAAPYQFSIVDGELPDGLVLDPASGGITGTPGAQTPESFTVQVTDNDGQSVVCGYTIVIYPEGTILVGGHLPPPLVVTTSNANMNAVVGVPFSVTLAAAGGGGSNYTFSVSNMGTLPAGLAFASDGKTIQGTPTAAGTCSFTATVHLGAKSASASLLLTVSEPLAFTTPSALPDVVRPQEYSQQIQISGGYGQKTLSQSGTLPPGMLLSASGLLSGRPTASGLYTFSVTASDSGFHSISRDFTMTVLDPPLPEQPSIGFQIPSTEYQTAALLWTTLPTHPEGSSATDFDGDGITNEQEYRMSQMDPVHFPMRGAMIDPNDWDGDGIDNNFERAMGLNEFKFADAMEDADGDGLVNYDEIKILGESYNANFQQAYSIRDSHQAPTNGEDPAPAFILSATCPLTDGQLMRCRRDIERADFFPGTTGGDMYNSETGETTYVPATNPAPATEDYFVWEDVDVNNQPDGYDLWLTSLANGDTNPNLAATADVDGDSIPNLWEHRYRLAFYDAENAGDETNWLQTPGASTGLADQREKQDPDHDTSVNLREFHAFTNPALEDTDGDGFRDDSETMIGSDPKDFTSTPKQFPLTLTVVSGNFQSALIGSNLNLPLKVLALRNGFPSAGESLIFSSEQADFSEFHSPTYVAYTGPDGTASVISRIFDATNAGSFNISVVGAGASLVFTATALSSTGGSGTTTTGGSGTTTTGSVVEPILVFYMRPVQASAVCSGFKSYKEGDNTYYTQQKLTRTIAASVTQTGGGINNYSHNLDDTINSTTTDIWVVKNPVRTTPLTKPFEIEHKSSDLSESEHAHYKTIAGTYHYDEYTYDWFVNASILNTLASATRKWTSKRQELSNTPMITNNYNDTYDTFGKGKPMFWAAVDGQRVNRQVITGTTKTYTLTEDWVKDENDEFFNSHFAQHCVTVDKNELSGTDFSKQDVIDALPPALAAAASTAKQGSANFSKLPIRSTFYIADYSPPSAHALNVEYYAALEWPAGMENAPNKNTSAKICTWSEVYMSNDKSKTSTRTRTEKLQPGDKTETILLSAYAVNHDKSGAITIDEPKQENVAIYVNDTPEAEDDIVRKEQKVTDKAWRQWIPCTVIVANASESQITSIVASSENDTMKFAQVGSKKPNDDTEGNFNVSVTLDEQGKGQFWITGVTQSANKRDAKLQIRKNGATGSMLATQPMTVFWFDSMVKAKARQDPSATAITLGAGNSSFGVQGAGMQVGGSASILPTGLDHTVAQIADWQFGVVQNVTTTRTWRGTFMLNGAQKTARGTMQMTNKLDTFHSAPDYLLQIDEIDGDQKFEDSRPATSVISDAPTMPADIRDWMRYQGQSLQWIESDMRDTFTIWSGIVEVKSGQIRTVFIPIKQNDWKVHGKSSQQNQQATPSTGDGTSPTLVPSIQHPSAIEDGNQPADKAYQWNIEN